MTMPAKDQVKGLTIAARAIANKDPGEFVIMLVDTHRTANIFNDLLIRAFGISKKRITKLGPTSTNLRDALNLAKQRDIVIAPRALVANSSPVFCPPDDATGVIVITAEGDQPQIAHHKTDGKPFKLT